MSHNPDSITLKNCQYKRSRRSRAVKPLAVQTSVKVGGCSNPNCLLFFFDFFFQFDAMAKQTPFCYSADAKESIRNIHDFYKREKEDELKILLNHVKEKASTTTGVSKSMIERVMRRDNATEQNPQLIRVQFFKASLA